MKFALKNLAILFITSLIAHPTPVQSHTKSPRAFKQQLKAVYAPFHKTFFCEFDYNAQGIVNFQHCRDCPSIPTPIEWMPIVPKSQLASARLCFKEKICVDAKGNRFKGLRCCQKYDSFYQQMIKDLHNWVPDLSYFRQQRGQKSFGIIDNSMPSGCYFKVDKKNKRVEPSPQIRGMIARTYLYMRDTYHFSLSAQENAQFLAWHHEYPPTQWEKIRNQKIAQIQGNANPYVHE